MISRLQFLAFSLFHTLGTLALILFFGSILGCQKNLDEPIDDGPETSLDVIANSVSQGMDGRSYADSTVGDWVLFESRQRLFTQPEQPTQLMTREVKNKKDSSDPQILDLEILKTKYTSDGVPQEQPLDRCQVLKNGNDTNCEAIFPVTYRRKGATSESTLMSFFSFEGSAQLIQPNSVVQTFHNFSSVKLEVAAPDKVAARPDCGSLPNCRMSITRLDFDQVIVDSGQRTRYHHQLDFTPQVPWIASLVKYCQRWNYKVSDERYVPAQLCSTVVDFKKP